MGASSLKVPVLEPHGAEKGNVQDASGRGVKRVPLSKLMCKPGEDFPLSAPFEEAWVHPHSSRECNGNGRVGQPSFALNINLL